MSHLAPRVLLVLLSLATACGGKSGRGLPASKYDRTCTQSSDCSPIIEGDATCANAAINEKDVQTYLKDTAGRCMEMACPQGACAGGIITCPQGECVFTPAGGSSNTDAAAAARSVTAADYPNTCTTVADCVAVYEGQLGCCGQGCANATIRQDALAQYMADVGRREPICVPIPPCIAPPQCPDRRITCENGTCGLAPATAQPN